MTRKSRRRLQGLNRRIDYLAMRYGIAGVLALFVSGPALAAGEDCGNPYGAKCSVELSTGVTMSYIDMGPRDGPAVLFLHGYTDSTIAWARTMTTLHGLAPNLRLIALDQRGAGGGTTELPDTEECRTSPARCLTTMARSKDVLAFANRMKLARFHLAGHSMGSVVARQVALASPSRIESLVLISTPDARPAGQVGLAGITAFPDTLLAGDGPFSIAEWKAALSSKGIAWPRQAYNLRLIDFDPDAVQHLLKYWVNSPLAPRDTLRDVAARTAMVRLKYFGIDPDAVEAPAEPLDRLAVPTFVLWGVQDTLMDKPMQDRLLKTLAVAAKASPQFHFVWKQYGSRPPAANEPQTDIGHEILVEAPESLAADLAQFIATQSPTKDSAKMSIEAQIPNALQGGVETLIITLPNR